MTTLLIGCGLGRCGTTSLSCNLQCQGWRVTHESGNNHSPDYRASVQDRFGLAARPAKVRKAHAAKIIADILAFSAGGDLGGDVSWVHSQIMQELLEADPRVILVVLYRKNAAAWLKSVAQHAPVPGRPETIVLKAEGISPAATGDRSARLRLCRNVVVKRAKAMQKLFGERVRLVAVEDLTAWGGAFVLELGGAEGFDAERGRNATGTTRAESLR